MTPDTPHDLVPHGRILRAGEGQAMGPELSTDRFMIDGAQTGGRFALVEQIVAPGALAAPVHKHSKEDEFTFVLEGTFAAMLGSQEIEAHAGDLVFKPRNEWHTFWNPGDVPCRVLEIISPAGLEEFFRLVDVPETQKDPERISELAALIGCDVDPERTAALVERTHLRF